MSGKFIIVDRDGDSDHASYDTAQAAQSEADMRNDPDTDYYYTPYTVYQRVGVSETTTGDIRDVVKDVLSAVLEQIQKGLK